MSEMTIAKKNKIINYIYEFMKILDKSEINAKYYKDFFNKMTLSEFDAYMKKFLNDPKKNFYIECMPYKNEFRLEDAKEALNFLGVPVEEYVYFRHDGNKNNPIRSAQKAMVGYLFIKKTQQILSKKNSYSLSIEERNQKTGQVTGKSKVARITDIETFGLCIYGSDKILAEVLGPRADNMTSKEKMYLDISNYGYTELQDMLKDIDSSQTLNTIDVYFLGSGLKTDLLTPTNELRRTLKNKKTPEKELFF